MTVKRVILAASMAAAGAALAHHSFAMFSLDKTVTIDGTVKEWQWTNPHSWLELTVKRPDGTLVQYSFESRSIYLLTRAHATRHSVVPGEMVKVTYNPLRDGSNGGSLVSATSETGAVLIGGGPGAPPPK